jgi:hypothetical protein
MEHPSSTTSATVIVAEPSHSIRVHFVDLEDESIQNWDPIDCVNAVLLSSMAPTDVCIPQSANALTELQRVYASGENSGKQVRVETGLESLEETLQVRTRKPWEKRHVRGLEGNPLDLRYVINGTRVDISLAQLIDVAPAVRVELAKLMRLTPAEKKQKASKRVRVHHLGHPH